MWELSLNRLDPKADADILSCYDGGVSEPGHIYTTVQNAVNLTLAGNSTIQKIDLETASESRMQFTEDLGLIESDRARVRSSNRRLY
jgi:hypothetical protein